jgi:hypothetical protein
MIAVASYLWEGVHQWHQEEAVELQAAQAGSRVSFNAASKSRQKNHIQCTPAVKTDSASTTSAVLCLLLPLSEVSLHQVNSCQQLTLSSTACTMKSLMPSNTCSAAQAYVSNQRRKEHAQATLIPALTFREHSALYSTRLTTHRMLQPPAATMHRTTSCLSHLCHHCCQCLPIPQLRRTACHDY